MGAFGNSSNETPASPSAGPSTSATDIPASREPCDANGSSAVPLRPAKDFVDTQIPLNNETGREASGSSAFHTTDGESSRDIKNSADSDQQAPAPTPELREYPLVITPPTPSAPSSANGAGNPNPPPPQPAADHDIPVVGGTPQRPTRGSSNTFKRSVSNLFRRTNSSVSAARPDMLLDDSRAHEIPTQQSSGTTLNDATRYKHGQGTFSLNTSQTTTRSNTPPSPGSPPEMHSGTGHDQSHMPAPGDFKKTRASTGLSLRGRAINFVQASSPNREKHDKKKKQHFGRRRSFEWEKPRDPDPGDDVSMYRSPPDPSPWPQIPDAGVGVKSRRLSISLPDDFHVEVADLLSEYEYQNKLLGRHGKHLGKGATSKVTLMARKGFSGELYAVKEFRNKSKADSSEEYEKKVKSEYTIAKSLRHPNIVETIQLCADHGRWNHIMEYCSDGDLFQLVEKGYLKDSARANDRLCLFKQVVQGVNYLHSNGVAHRDIKLENCLISNGSKLKITDFGVSEVFSGTHPGLREAGGQCGKNMCEVRLCSPGICGSEPYIAPEVLSKKQPYDPRGMDVWGAAIIMIFLTFGGNIWKRAELNAPGSRQYDLLVKQWEKWNAKHPEPEPRITDDDYPFYFPFDEMVSPPALRRVLLMMLNPDPARRASIADIANHRWIKNIECCQLDSYDDPAKYIDASKKGATRVNGQKKIFCHNHLPMQSHGHSLGKMPGQPGY